MDELVMLLRRRIREVERVKTNAKWEDTKTRADGRLMEINYLLVKLKRIARGNNVKM